jgi:hypothetical protein
MTTHRPFAGIVPVCALALLLALPFAPAACNSVTRVNTVEPEGMTAVPKEVLLRRITADASLGEGAQVVRAFEGRTPAGALQIQLMVANRTPGSETDFMWKCEWFDAAGMALPGQNPQWTKVILLPGQETTVALVAPSAGAVDWRYSMTTWQRK